jgi:hypothetical protein
VRAGDSGAGICERVFSAEVEKLLTAEDAEGAGESGTANKRKVPRLRSAAPHFARMAGLEECGYTRLWGSGGRKASGRVEVDVD